MNGTATRTTTARKSSDDNKNIWFPQAAARGDSDPDANEALRRVRSLPHRIPGAIKRAVEVEAAYAERERLLRATVTAERIMAGVL